MKLSLEITESARKDSSIYPWKTALPFVENSRGILIHRPRMVSTHTGLSRSNPSRWRPHIGIGFWCGMHVSGDKNFTFLLAPPENGLVCHRCEAVAIANGFPSSAELAGRHVHIGRVKAVKDCCKDEE